MSSLAGHSSRSCLHHGVQHAQGAARALGRSMMRPTHLLNDQVTVPNVPSESGRATSDELVIIFKLVTFFKIYSTALLSQPGALLPPATPPTPEPATTQWHEPLNRPKKGPHRLHRPLPDSKNICTKQFNVVRPPKRPSFQRAPRSGAESGRV